MSAERSDVTELDLSGLKCPLPVLRTRKALRGLLPGATLAVLSTDPLAAIDIPHLVRSEGDSLLGQERRDGAIRFVIRRMPR
ncbi:MAG: sulfurtransferase TusA family protein [Methylobacterium sp.]|uniref:sulfurtransferase TusA family protein n=1 Tax=Methylobacterium sp. TaxID=409 RepID=UPI0027178948|nr:sulfurtransferase TusA family protein [Methylobacterium sp.]MDO9426386.1 sulfurtransferase TusA family protein [Methylobacterium sp.]